MGRATISSINRNNTPVETRESDDEYQSEANGTWIKLWKGVFIFYLPVTVVLEVWLVVLMSSWPTVTPAESEYTHSIVNGWVNMLLLQVVIPILSFFIRMFVELFIRRRFEINLISRISRKAAIPLLAISFLLLIFLGTLFGYMTKNFNLFTTLTTGFLFFSFYLSGIITTLSWVVFILERNNPYEASP